MNPAQMDCVKTMLVQLNQWKADGYLGEYDISDVRMTLQVGEFSYEIYEADATSGFVVCPA